MKKRRGLIAIRNILCCHHSWHIPTTVAVANICKLIFRIFISCFRNALFDYYYALIKVGYGSYYKIFLATFPVEFLQHKKIYTMKKLLTLTIVLFISAAVLAQNPVPNMMNYQAVARNASGQALANQNIGVKLSVVQGAAVLYTETRGVTTNTLGLFNVQIGSSGAANQAGELKDIDWISADPPVQLKVELDINNSGVFTDMGSQALQSVPYSFAAQTAQNSNQIGGRNVSANATPTNGQVLTWDAGTASWKPATLSTSSSAYIGFRADVKTNQVISTSTATILFDHEQHDSGAVYNPSTSKFTAPEAGMYMLYATVTIYPQFNTGTEEGANIYFYSNMQGALQYVGVNARQGMNADMVYSLNAMIVQHLSAGETIDLRIWRNNPTNNWNILDMGSSFGAYKIK
jgi:hypothetical protein